MMPSLKQHARNFSTSLSDATDSPVVHLQTIRKAIGYIALTLPFALVAGENLRDVLLRGAPGANRTMIEASISAYFHTGMREVFVGSLCAIAVFLLCYKGYDRRDNLAGKFAGFCVLLVALFPTFERSREASDTGVPAPDSATLFSSATGADPLIVGYIHFIAAALFFTTLAVMSLFLFTRSNQPQPTARKVQRNKVFVACGVTILACIAAIAAGKFIFSDEWGQRTSFVFWLESVAVVAFGISWLTKAEVIFGDSYAGVVQPMSGARTAASSDGMSGLVAGD
jgi:hypothetical protein